MDSSFLEKFEERKYQVILVGLRTGQTDLETSSILLGFINLSLFLAVKRKWGAGIFIHTISPRSIPSSLQSGLEKAILTYY